MIRQLEKYKKDFKFKEKKNNKNLLLGIATRNGEEPEYIYAMDTNILKEKIKEKIHYLINEKGIEQEETFGEGSWRYCFLLALLVAIPLMIFWAKYSTADRINTLYQHIDSQGLTRPATQESSHVAKGEGMKTFLRTLRNRNISLTAGNTLLTQIVYMGINVVLPPYLYHVSGLSLAASAGLSIIFTLTGTLGQVIWPWLSDSFGRKRTLIVCGLWMSNGIALFYFATNMPRLIAIQLFFGLVANAVWPIYYAMASDSAEERATSTANGIITTAIFIGGGISPLLMGWLIQFGGGWENPAGYIYAFFTMAGCALLGMLLQLMTTDKTPRKAH